MLPHGVARMAVLDLPAGPEPGEYARFRLAASVPYPASDAVVDFLPLERGRILAAAVRREVVAEYEDAAAAAGIARGRVDLAPLAAASGAAHLRGFEAATVFLVLGDVACSLLAYEGGRLLAVRTRRRDRNRGEAERLRLDALRTAAAAGLFGEPELVVAGSGARGPRPLGRGRTRGPADVAVARGRPPSRGRDAALARGRPVLMRARDFSTEPRLPGAGSP